MLNGSSTLQISADQEKEEKKRKGQRHHPLLQLFALAAGLKDRTSDRISAVDSSSAESTCLSLESVSSCKVITSTRSPEPPVMNIPSNQTIVRH